MKKIENNDNDSITIMMGEMGKRKWKEEEKKMENEERKKREEENE